MILADALRATLVKPHQGSRGFVQEESQRIIECFASEGTFRGHLAQPPCHKQGHLQLDQVSQSPFQPNLENFQGGDIYNFSGQPVPVFHHPHSKQYLRYIKLKSTVFQFNPITLVLSLHALVKSPLAFL